MARSRRQQQENFEEACPRPKPGPGQVFRRELIDAQSGHAKRYRNIAITPLTLAFETGKLTTDAERRWQRDPVKHRVPGIIAVDRRDCGEKFSRWYAVRMGGGTRDSSQPLINGGVQATFTERQEHAGRQLQFVRGKMGRQNFLIVEAFCGNGCSMIESLRVAGVEAHPVGTAYRIREALDDLVAVMTGRFLIPMLVPCTRRNTVEHP